ncbi:MAG: hypothetical protein U0524_02625 [Candidatus Saccharimonadales bacterium]
MEAGSRELFAHELGLEIGFDPLGLATQAIQKLKEHHLSTRIKDAPRDILLPDTSQVVEVPLLAEIVTEDPIHKTPETQKDSYKAGFISIGGELYKPADILREENDQEFTRKTSAAAVYCQQLLRKAQFEELLLDENRELASALSWIEDAVKPTMLGICRRYTANQRYGRHDMMQTMREHTVTSIIPQYDLTKGSFHAYFAGSAWRRVDEEVGRNMSYFRTPSAGVRLSEESKAKAFNAFSYHSVDTENKDDMSGLDFLGPSSYNNPVRAVLAQEVLSVVKEATENFTVIEKIAFEQVLLGEQEYAEVADKNNLPDVKTVDNALQRVKRKIAKAMADNNLSSDLE